MSTTACYEGVDGEFDEADRAQPSPGGVLVESTFNAGSPWQWSSWALGGANATHGLANRGTIDSRDGSPTQAVVLEANTAGAAGYWQAGLNTSWIGIQSEQTQLSHLNLSFDLWASEARSVRVFIRGFDAEDEPTGMIETVVVPPVARSFFRHSIDLDRMAGTLAPDSEYVQIFFEISNTTDQGTDPWPRSQGNSIRVDNLSIAAPRYFVRPASEGGNDGNPGTAPSAAFATIQRAVDAATPGDVIFVMNGTYTNAWTNGQVVEINKAGAPSRWIVLRNYPGHTPVLTTRIDKPAWHGIRMLPKAAYIEVRGLHLQGNNYDSALTLAAAQADADKVDDDYTGNPLYNTNGITIDGRVAGQPNADRPHHIRLIGNRVNAWPGGGLGPIESDYVTIADNVSYDNAWYSAHATSGTGALHAWNFDESTDYRYFFIGNTLTGNKSLVKWVLIGKVSDGNGLIVDDFWNTQASSHIRNQAYLGRVLVQNNVAYNNGGGGIQVFKSSNVTVANNTAWKNSTVLSEGYAEIYSNQASKVQFVQNVMWAAAGRAVNASSGTELTLTRNLLYGDGNNDADVGPTDVWANPRFENPTTGLGADFRLRSNSPAVDAGDFSLPGVPRLDRAGTGRNRGSAPDLGAFER